MGIDPLHAKLLILEHAARPLPETVHLLGRQTVSLTFEEALNLITSTGVEPKVSAVELDTQTRGAQASSRQLISDRTFFGLLGASQVLAIDHSDYEGADIIIDLNAPLPAEHQLSVDFLYGGSVLDNIFDPAAYLRNISRLLRPGGRLFEQDVLSHHHHPYCLITPAWIFDYCVVNRYSSCTIYVAEYSAGGFTQMYGLNASADELISDLGPARGMLPMGIIFVAEKGEHSTADVSPIQDQYRTEEAKRQYRDAFAAMKRPLLPRFAAPTAGELARLSVRTSRSFQYLGVVRSVEPNESPVSGISVLQATYANGGTPVKSANSSGYTGNATELLGSILNGRDACEWTVDANILSDPDPERGKYLEVIYTHSTDPIVRRAFLEAEAAGKVLKLP
jgi:hypothetical protein